MIDKSNQLIISFWQLFLPQSSRQETFLALMGFERTEKSETLSNAPH